MKPGLCDMCDGQARRRAPAADTAFFLALVIAVQVLLACDQSDPAPLPGNAEQPSSIAVSGARLFVTSPPRDALHVLELGDAEADPYYIRAPNPLFPLEVPTVRRPDVLHAVDPPNSQRRPLVVVLSSVDYQLRVIDAESLRPLGRPVPLAGRPIAVDSCAVGDEIFIALLWPDGVEDAGAVMRASFSPAVLERGARISDGDSPLSQIDVVGLDLVPAGLAVIETDSSRAVWVSDLQAPRVMRIDLDTEEVEEISTPEPLTSLTSLKPSQLADQGPPVAFVYGLTADGRGLLALDEESRDVASRHVFDGETTPMPLPQRAVALTAVANAVVEIGESDDREALQAPVLLLLSLVDGRVLYVDGVTVVPVDVHGRLVPEPDATMHPAANLIDDSGRYTGDLDYSAPMLVTTDNPDHVAGADEPSHVALVDLSPGVTRSRTWRVSWRALIPGHSPALGSIHGSDDEIIVRPSWALDDLAHRVAALDELTISSAPRAGAGADCQRYAEPADRVWQVVDVDSADAGMVLGPMRPGQPLPEAACFDLPIVYSVRSSGYTVVGDGLSQVWRLEPGEIFEYAGLPFIRTEEGSSAVEVRFTLAEIQDESSMDDGAERQLRVRLGLENVAMTPDVAGLGLPRATIPGRTVVHHHSLDEGAARVFIPYAGPGYLLSFDLKTRAAQRAHR